MALPDCCLFSLNILRCILATVPVLGIADVRLTAPTNGSMVKESEKCGLAGRFNIRQSEKWTDRTPNHRLGSFCCRPLWKFEWGWGKSGAGSDLVKFAEGIHCERAVRQLVMIRISRHTKVVDGFTFCLWDYSYMMSVVGRGRPKEDKSTDMGHECDCNKGEEDNFVEVSCE